MSGITLFGCPVTNDYLQLLKKAAGYDPADDVGIVKIVATDDKKVTVHWDDGTTSELVNVSAAASSFDDLTDTPASKSGQALKGLRVDSAEATLEYVGIATAGHTHSWTDVSKTGSKLSDLGDVPSYVADKCLKVDSSGTTLTWGDCGSGSGASSYDDLTDTPSSKSGNAYKLVAVNSSGTSLVYIDREDVWEGTMYSKKVDYNTDGQPLYEGWAAPGSSTSDAVWRIKKIEYDSNGRVTGEVWADGNTNFDNTWDTKSAISTWS